MKLACLVAGLGAMSVLECTYAYPNMATSINEIKSRIQNADRRSLHRRIPKNGAPDTAVEAPEPIDPNDDGSLPGVLIGDIKNGGKTPVGKAIARILLEKEPGQSTSESYRIPGYFGSDKCKADTCCVWAHISNQLTGLFRGPSNRCNKYARAAIRLGFHDAGAWQEGLTYGGADGSIVLAVGELQRPENKGLEDIVKVLWDIQRKFGVGMADMIQFASKHAVVTCPLGPRIRTFVGRKDSARPAKDGLLPGVNDSADKLLALFAAKTISPHSLVALLGAHSTSEQFSHNPSRKGAPQDGTPGVWDTLFYNQTLGLGPLPPAVLRFPSDLVLAADPRTRDEWVRFTGSGGQEHWNEDYAYSYVRLSLLGVNNINSLTECTKVLPAPKTVFRGAGDLLKTE